MHTIEGKLPVTLPINATEDRVVGGWDIDELMQGQAVWKHGLLKEAHSGLLYIDEVNLLDDHIVNIILDVSASGVLVVQREGKGEKEPEPVAFILVGTMNPEEGGLRPQLLDRFGLMVAVQAETDDEKRRQILNTVLDFDNALQEIKNKQPSEFFQQVEQEKQTHKKRIDDAKEMFGKMGKLPDAILSKCVTIAKEFDVEGHRGDLVMALAAKACAALEGKTNVQPEHLKKVAPLTLQHRRKKALESDQNLWSAEDEYLLEELLAI